VLPGSDRGGGQHKKEKLIKTKFISFGFVVVEEFLIKKSAAVGVRRIKKSFAAAAFAFSSNLKSVHLSRFFPLRFYVCFISHCTRSLFRHRPFHLSSNFFTHLNFHPLLS
jgi:hypothetical protein